LRDGALELAADALERVLAGGKIACREYALVLANDHEGQPVRLIAQSDEGASDRLPGRALHHARNRCVVVRRLRSPGASQHQAGCGPHAQIASEMPQCHLTSSSWLIPEVLSGLAGMMVSTNGDANGERRERTNVSAGCKHTRNRQLVWGEI
jgi:hypothetical protein